MFYQSSDFVQYMLLQSIEKNSIRLVCLIILDYFLHNSDYRLWSSRPTMDFQNFFFHLCEGNLVEEPFV